MFCEALKCPKFQFLPTKEHSGAVQSSLVSLKGLFNPGLPTAVNPRWAVPGELHLQTEHPGKYPVRLVGKHPVFLRPGKTGEGFPG